MIITTKRGVKFGGLSAGSAFSFLNDVYMVIDGNGYIFNLPANAGIAVNLSTGKLSCFLLTEEVRICPIEIYSE